MIDINKNTLRFIDLAVTGKLLPSEGYNKKFVNELSISNEEYNLFFKNKKRISIKDIENIPFNLPDNWIWIRLGNVASIFGRIGFRGYTKEDLREKGDGAITISPSNILKNGYTDFTQSTYISFEKYEESPEIKIQNGDLIFVKTGSCGKVAIVEGLNCKATINPQLAVLKFIKVNKYYLKYVLSSSVIKKQLDEIIIGAVTPTLSQEDMANLLIPLPPIELQNDLANKLNELIFEMSVVEKYQLLLLNDLEKLKKKIIDENIYNNENVKNIQKNKWISLSSITDDKHLNDGNWILSDDMSPEGPVNLIQLGNIGDMCFKETNYKHLTENHFKELNCRQIYPGYLLINRLVADKMLSCILPNVDGKLITSVDVCWVSPNENLYNIKYILYVLSSSYFQNEVMLKGKGVTRFRISKTNLINIPFPLPELNVQNEIANKIENILKLLDASLT